MTKKELVRDLAKRQGRTVRESEEMVTAVFDELFDILSEKNELSYPGFGKFELSLKKEMKIHSLTGEDVIVPEHNILRFKPGAALKENVK